MKKILIGLLLLVLPIMTHSQVVLEDKGELSSIGSTNFKNLRTGVKESWGNINVTSSQMLSGDSIVCLIGARKAVISELVVVYTPNTTPYTTTGSTDTVFIYSKTDVGNKKLAAINDNIFDETLATPSAASSGTPGSMIDSCLYWIDIPSSKYTLGDGNWDLLFKYVILE